MLIFIVVVVLEELEELEYVLCFTNPGMNTEYHRLFSTVAYCHLQLCAWNTEAVL